MIKVRFSYLDDEHITYDFLESKIWCVRMEAYLPNSGVLHTDDSVLRWFFISKDLEDFLLLKSPLTVGFPEQEKWKFGYDPCDIFNPDEEYLDWLGKYIHQLKLTNFSKKSTPTLIRLKRRIRYLLYDPHSGGPGYRSKIWYELVEYSKKIQEELNKRNSIQQTKIN